ncbi:MAG: hypothetical protein HZA53_12810 [Planctomycetes bacterium]|nr:hypothetical protein [Planctomycetota bacterium]
MKLTLPLLFALAVGFLLGWTVTRAPETPERVAREAPSASSSALERAAAIESAAQPASAAVAPRAADSAAPRVSEGLISDALRAYALEELAAGWSVVRPDPMPAPIVARGFDEFETTVRALPRQIGRRLAERRTRADALASDDPFAVLKALDEENLGPQLELVLDRERFRRFFACSGGPRVDGVALIRAPEHGELELAPGTTIVFPAGVFDTSRLSNRMRKGLRCITLVGAGMDATLLLSDEIAPRDGLDRFEVRDCTLHTDCDAIGLNSVAGVFRAERVRFTGFDCGAGGSSLLFGTSGILFEFVGCRIEGGYGRDPGGGHLFDVRTRALLARFEDCHLDALSLAPHGWRDGISLAFVRCRLERIRDAQLPPDRDDDGILFQSSTVELEPQSSQGFEKRDLNALFPDWQPRVVR